MNERKLYFNKVAMQRHMKKEMAAGDNDIAGLNFGSVNNVLLNKSSFLFFNASKKQAELHAKDASLNDYAAFYKNAAQLLTQKTASPNAFLRKTEQLQKEFTYSFTNKSKSYTNFANIQKGYGRLQEYFANNAGLAQLDIETLGGKTKSGVSDSGPMIEYSFHLYEKYGASPNKVRGFIGLSQNQYEKYVGIAEAVENNTASHQDRLTFERFAKLVHSETSIREDKTTLGRFLIEKWAQDDTALYTKENFFRGLEKARNIGIKQDHSKINGMAVWEKDLIDAMAQIKTNNMAVSGYNIDYFDLPVLNKTFTKMSVEAENYAKGKGITDFQLATGTSFDLFPLVKSASGDKEFAKMIWNDDSKKILSDYQLSPYSQEALVRRFFPNMYDVSGAHTADIDVLAYNQLLTTARLGNKSFVDAAYAAAMKQSGNNVTGIIKPNDQQLFLATKGLGDNYNGQRLIGFTIDDLHNEIRTFDGHLLKNGKLSTAGFKEFGSKAGVSYSLSDIYSFEVDNSLTAQLEKINPNLAGEKLVALELSTVTDKTIYSHADFIAKNNLRTVVMGTHEDVQSWLSDSMILYAEKNNAGEYKLVPGARQYLEKYELRQKNGRTALVKSTPLEDAELIKETIKDGSFIGMNDSAARAIREDSYKRYKALSQISQQISKTIADNGLAQNNASKSEVLRSMLELSRDVSKITASNNTAALELQHISLRSLQDVLGQKNLTRHSVDNIIANLEYFDSISPIIDLAMEKIEARSSSINGNKQKQFYENFAMKQTLDAVRGEVLEKLSSDNLDSEVGYIKGYNSNYFELAITDLFNKPKAGRKIGKAVFDNNIEQTLKISLDRTQAASLVKKVLNAAGQNNIEISAAEANQILFKLVERGKDQGLGDLLKNIKSKGAQYFTDLSPTLFAEDIISELALKRSLDPSAGFLSPNIVQNVLEGSQMAGVLSVAQLDNVMENTLAQINPSRIKTSYYDNKNIKKMAQQLTENYFVDPFDTNSQNELAKKYGYSSDQIKKLKTVHRVLAKDYRDLMSTFLTGVKHIEGAGVFADKRSGTFGLVSKTGEFIDLSYMPKTRLRDGIFVTELGNMQFASALEVGIKRRLPEKMGDFAISLKDTDFYLRSNIGGAKEQAWNLSSSIKRALASGEDPYQEISRYSKRFAGFIRANPNLSDFNNQEIKHQFQVKISDFAKALPFLLEQGRFDKPELALMAEKFKQTNVSWENLTDAQKQLFAKNFKGLLQDVASNSLDGNLKSVVQDINILAKASAIDAGYTSFSDISEGFEQFVKISRDVTNQTELAPFRTSLAQQKLKELKLKDVQLGANIGTSFGHALSAKKFAGTDDTFKTDFIAKRLNATSQSLAEKIVSLRQGYSIDSPEAKAIDDILLLANLSEGGALGDARIADALDMQSDFQKIAIRQEISNSTKNSEAVRNFQRLIPKPVIDTDGKVKFRYTTGQYVNKLDEIFSIIDYGKVTNNIQAEDDGIVKFGLFTKAGKLATAQEVLGHVKKNAPEKLSAENFMNYALQEYQGYFYIQKVKATTQRKLLENRSEKNMVTFLYGGLGQYNDKVAKAIELLGLSKYQNNVFSEAVFEQLKTGNLAILRQMSPGLNQRKLTNAIKEAGFADLEEFGQALHAERFLPSRLFKSATKAHFALTDESAKHGSNFVPAVQALNEYIAKTARTLKLKEGLDEEAALAKAKETTQKNFAQYFSNNLEFDGNNLIIKPFTAGESIDVAGILEKSPLSISGVTYNSYAFKKDYAGLGSLDAKKQGLKFTDRELGMLLVDRYDESMLSRLKDKLSPDEFHDRFGHLLDSEGKLKANLQGQSILSEYVDEVKNYQFVGNDSRLVMQNGVFNDQALAGLTNRDKKRAEAGAKAIAATGRTNVSVSAALNNYAGAMGLLANQFNIGAEQVDSLLEHGFKAAKIDQIDKITEASVRYHKDFSGLSAAADDLVIDMLDDKAFTQDTLGKYGIRRYVAVNHAPWDRLTSGEEFALDEQRKALNSVLNLRSNILSEKKNGDGTLQLDRYYDQVRTQVENLNELAAKNITDKTGYLRANAEPRLLRSASGKAFVNKILTDTNLNSSAFDKMLYEGRSIAEHYAEGNLVDFNIMSMDQFEAMGFFDKDYLDSVGGKSVDEIKHMLKTEGILATSNRYPTIYRGSMRPVRAYLNESVKGNMNISSFAGSIRAKQDADGDVNNIRVVTFDGLDEYQNRLSSRGTAERAGKFRRISDLMYYNAAVENHYFEGAQEAGEKKLAEIVSARPNLLNQLSPDDAKQYERIFARVQDNIYESFAKEHSLTLSEAKAQLADDTDGFINAIAKSKLNNDEKIASELWLQGQKADSAWMSKFKRSAAGQINLTLYNLRKLRNMGADMLSREDVSLLEATFEAAEEGFLSPKHTDGRIMDQLLMIEEFNEALSKTQKGQDGGKEALAGWLIDHAKKDRLLKGEHLNLFASEDDALTEAASVLERLFDNIPDSSSYDKYFSLGTRKTGLRPGEVARAFAVPLEDDSMMADSARAMLNVLRKDRVEQSVFASGRPHSFIDDMQYAEDIFVKPAGFARAETESIMELVQSKLQKTNIKGKSLAYSAIGIAGAVMLAGFVGGNPTKPAETQAQEQAQLNPYLNSLQLADPNFVNLNANPQQGYVININAQTSEGQKFAQEAIKQAMSQNFDHSTINVALNIQDSSKANTQQLMKMLQTAFS